MPKHCVLKQMKKQFMSLTLLMTFGATDASATLNAELAAKVDAVREGKIPKTVLAFGKRLLISPCIDPGDVHDDGPIVVTPVFNIMKISSSSGQVGHSSLRYHYSARYLVVKLCPDGQTQGGASLDFQSAAVIEADFDPRRTKEPLSIVTVKELTPTDLAEWLTEAHY
jgi:hypothetical protein